MSPTLEVDLGERSYPIYIEAGLLGTPRILCRHVRGEQVLVVTDEVVWALHGERIRHAFSARQLEVMVLAPGEASKSLHNLERIFDRLLGAGFNRSSTVVAFGGGVIGDLAGFAAACYQRGVPYLQVPTTLLAQVDSSVGGKTAVNHPRGKNMIGAFYQPVAVIADTAALATLPERELRAGLAEVIKYGVLWDAAFFDWMGSHMNALLARAPDAIGHAVRRCCEIKAQVVGRDERERGVRARLNLGHTFAHAIETGLGFGEWLHGEAVAAGLCMASDLACRLGWIDPVERERVEAVVQRAGLPTRAPSSIPVERMLELMALDKKALDSGIRLVLPQRIGATVVTGAFDPAALRKTLEQCRE